MDAVEHPSLILYFFLYQKRAEIISNLLNSNSYFGCFFANSLRQYAFKLVVIIVLRICLREGSFPRGSNHVFCHNFVPIHKNTRGLSPLLILLILFPYMWGWGGGGGERNCTYQICHLKLTSAIFF